MSNNEKLQRSKFPLCCGATILYGFGWNFAPEHLHMQPSDDPTKDEIKQFLSEQPILNSGTGNIHDWHEMKRNSFHMAILNEKQKSHLHDLFVEAGFELMASNSNEHSGGRLNHLYVRQVKH